MVMILCIESYLGDTFLSGKARTMRKLKAQLLQAERLCDPEHDNFLPLLCRLYGFEEIPEDVPDLTWDRDAGLLLPI